MQHFWAWLRERAVHWIPALPLSILVLLIWRCGVNVPHWDQWDFAPLFIKASESSLGFSDLFAQHNESRPFFPRLFFLCAGWLTRWDVRLEMFTSLALAALTAGNIYRLCRQTFGEANAWTWLCCCLVNLLLFNPVQHENWLWGMQLMLYVPAACISSCLVVLISQRTANAKLLICAALSTIATFSFANGMSAWVILFPVLLCSVPKEDRVRVGGAWMAAFGLNLFAYFNDYYAPNTPGLSNALQHPLEALRFWLIFLGSPLGWGFGSRSMLLSTLFGAAILVGLTAVVGILLRKRQRSAWLLAAPWLALAAYGLMTSLTTTLGRFAFGFGQALVSRYIAFSIYPLIGLIGLLLLLLVSQQDDEQEESSTPKTRTWRWYGAIALLAVYVLTQAATYRAGIGKFETARRERAYSKACLLCIRHVEAEGLARLVYPDVSVLKTRAAELNAVRMLTPPLIEKDLRVWAQSTSDATQSRASFTEEPGGTWAICGDGLGEPAVVISRTGKNKDCVPIAVAEVNAAGAWTLRIPAERLEPGDVLIAWGIDPESATLQNLGDHKITE
jgi:hypothetical protein